LKNSHIVFIARDSAPSRTFQLLIEKLPGAVSFLGNVADINTTDTEIKQAVSKAKILVLGMSHSPEASRLELLAGQSVCKQTKVVLFADSFFCSTRSWFEPLHNRADIVLTCTKSEVVLAQQLFQQASVFAKGNPLWEANYFRAMNERCNRKTIRTNIGVGSTQKLAFVPLRKEHYINIAHLSVIVEIGSLFPEIQFCITTHPGEPNSDIALRLYEELISKLDNFRIVKISTPEMLSVCDFVINAGSGVGVEALYMNLPVVEFLPDIVLDELERIQGGARVWQPCEDGAAIPVINSTEMKAIINEFISIDSRKASKVLANQRNYYPAPKIQGAAIQSMLSEMN